VDSAEHPDANAPLPIDLDPPLNASPTQAARNIRASYVALGLSIASSLALTPILLRILGPTAFGIFTILQSLTLYLGLLDAGITTSLSQKVTTLLAHNSQSDLRLTLATAQRFYIVTAVLVVGLAAAVSPYAANLLHVHGLLRSQIRWGTILFGAATAFTFLQARNVAAVRGAGRGDRLALLSTGLGIIMRAAQIAIVLSGGGLLGAIIVADIFGIIGMVATSLLRQRTVSGIIDTRDRAQWAVLRDLLRSGSRNAAGAVAGTIAYGLDTIIIGSLLSAEKATPYIIAAKVTGLVTTLATTGANAVMPNLAHAAATEDFTLAFRLYRAMLFSSLFIAVPAEIALALIGSQVVHVWLGVVPTRVGSILVALAIVSVAYIAGAGSSVVLVALDRNRVPALLAFPVAFANLGLSVWATLTFGPIGPALGSLPLALLVECVVYPFLVCRYLGAHIAVILRTVLMPVVGMSLVCILVGFALRLAMSGASPLWSLPAVLGVIGAGWASVVPWLGRFQPDLVEMLRGHGGFAGRAIARAARHGAAR